MKGTTIYLLILFTAALILMATAKYLPIQVEVIAVLSIIILSLLRAIYIFRKKVRNSGALQQTGLAKVSFYIICSSAFGVFISLILVVLKIRPFGQLFLNFSLVCCLLGIFLGIFAPAKLNVSAAGPAQNRLAFVSGKVIYASGFLMITGLFFRINHYPAGKLLMFAGLITTLGFLIILIIWSKYEKRKLS